LQAKTAGCKSQGEEACSSSLCHHLHLLFLLSLVWRELLLPAAPEQRITIRSAAVRQSALHTPAEIPCPCPQTPRVSLGRIRVLLQRAKPGPRLTPNQTRGFCSSTLCSSIPEIYNPPTALGVKKHHQAQLLCGNEQKRNN